MLNVITTPVLADVRSIADTLGPLERAEFLRDLARQVYDAEKFTGAGGDGLDLRGSDARRAIGRVVDEAEKAIDALR